jgi:transcriptional regulator with XRE-family HTH domain
MVAVLMVKTGDDKKNAAAVERDARLRIAARLEEARRAQGLTLRFLEDAAQLTRASLSPVFAGKSNITIKTLAKLAYALDLDVADLLKPGPGPKASFQRGRPRTRRASLTKRTP